MKRATVLTLLAVLALSGCAETPETASEKTVNRQISELETPGSTLRHRLEKAAEHLPPGSSIAEQTAQAEREAR